MEATKFYGCQQANNLSASEMGVGREAMSVMCGVLNMPPPCNHSAWDKHMAALHKAHKEVVDEQLKSEREKVRTLYQGEEGDQIKVAVTYDGTWSKRGYTANFGVGFVISVDTARISHSIRKKQKKEKNRRSKIRQAKLAAKLAAKERESSYSSGKYNELDPLLPCGSSSDSDDVPLAQMLIKDKE